MCAVMTITLHVTKLNSRLGYSLEQQVRRIVVYHGMIFWAKWEKS